MVKENKKNIDDLTYAEVKKNNNGYSTFIKQV